MVDDGRGTGWNTAEAATVFGHALVPAFRAGLNELQDSTHLGTHQECGLPPHFKPHA